MNSIDLQPTDLVSAAMVQICGDIPSIPRDKTVHVRSEKGSYTFKYAPLETILPVIKPIIAKHGCALVQYADDEHVITELRHKSGQTISTRTRIIGSGARNAEYGGSLTFARRYGIMLLFSLAVDEDLDADPANTTVIAANKDKHSPLGVVKVDGAAEKYAAAFRAALDEGDVVAVHHDCKAEGEELYRAAWSLLDSKERSAIKRAIDAAKDAA